MSWFNAGIPSGINVVEPAKDDKGLSDVVVDIAKRAAYEVLIKAQSADEFTSNVVSLVAGADPISLIGYDRNRIRALLRASTTDIFIGTMSQLQSGLGYPLPVGAGDEIKTIQEIYVKYNPLGSVDPNARVTYWAETRVG